MLFGWLTLVWTIFMHEVAESVAKAWKWIPWIKG